MKRNERECDRENQIDMWEERDFFLAELFGLRPYEPDPEPEDWNCKYHKFIYVNFSSYMLHANVTLLFYRKTTAIIFF